LRLLAEVPFPAATPPCEKAMLENPQSFQHCKFKIILPLLMRKAHAARISNPPAHPAGFFSPFCDKLRPLWYNKNVF
jgi:hypothetical protein